MKSGAVGLGASVQTVITIKSCFLFLSLSLFFFLRRWGMKFKRELESFCQGFCVSILQTEQTYIRSTHRHCSH